MLTVCVDSLWGDSSEFKSAVPFHHGQLNLMHYVFECVDDTVPRDSPQLRNFARLARDSSLVILRWGIESRIW